MKTLITLIAISLTAMVSNSAFAMHAYGNDNCITKTTTGATLEIDLINGRPANPHYIVDNDRQDGEGPQRVEFKGAKLGVDEPGGELVLQSKGDLNEVMNKISDGCFEGEKSTSARAAKVLYVSKKVSELYGIKKGQTLNFSCYVYYVAPTGSKCDH